MVKCCKFYLDFELVQCKIDGNVAASGLRLARFLHLLENTTKIPSWTTKMPILERIHVKSNYLPCCALANASDVRVIFQKCKACQGINAVNGFVVQELILQY